ncbi:2-amino-4-hydroxy-6-hydroxymethyldihydropteridine diphosphokinase [candidate division WOR-1 bacterium RIFOXYA12_FULL_43_27]|uniref:2-amino-4-hydroxy-6-hydroxymethyldihydropteridine diphosphokinase n=1 Tax=candidate division WOR-1 bacterium RIFOXYC2_FULL_46_14 TaxID=1802587 RepID=A0A1F4U2U7_UNCSA|nr:MAG: 2-amino-4-hydroxy-6-hydroxymethyldihydropteridine diphosphokinase [candidate division WOR-1 bacterium RIFOXYA12_FULL_43_27]OGC18889.1 MAG: 2-amino-4-hydroxy-6-hydroxymethyldihydropteridine diphosphokinase [candidate division WOR-1 bacterium RIFOXYB2_FULL_46_45]OGC29030.1 MAG: 2-amino-4-hydroxy-6-hydroxymethyldihydropteridine diphosphokinase [candidate division WOR-1 bacterium RIFOXYA2_FULL_46_56]OGC39284.1 MAG: 2-amino-4-hydroxy-6-hydroxymethyldihydropteridine diphosphokinase [candidate 
MAKKKKKAGTGLRPVRSNKKGLRPVQKAKKVDGKHPKIKGPQRVFLALGSNVGDREEYIEQAVFLISKIKGVEVLKRSTNHETEPEGDTDQPSFINAALEIKTELPPQKLLNEFTTIENALGRERETEWGPRTIDIDLLFYGKMIVSEDNLQIPHPLIHERTFVLEPMKEIAPEFTHPVLEKTIEELFEERKVESGHTYDDDLPGFKKIKGAIYDDYERW